MNICLFASDVIGYQTLKTFTTNEYKLTFLVLDSKESKSFNKKMIKLSNLSAKRIFYSNDLSNDSIIQLLNDAKLDLCILAWWNYIIKKPLLNISKLGFLNFHPSFLPYNRGKHYYFWNIIEKVPFGVSIHFINKDVDTGDIVFQELIQTSILDTGFSLREKSRVAIIKLFNENFNNIINLKLPRKKQNLKKGNFHVSSDLKDASRIKLDKKYLGQELIDLLRARSGFEKGGAWFEYEDKVYEVKIEIKEVINE
ncbi:hypothetical protein DZA35_00145 [Arcobacter sp. HD9-500m-PIT-SAG03]|nr:hypothetical protein DZA35_00145 [Arcobacter sp. HD9-500m-PIT-SAG03]